MNRTEHRLRDALDGAARTVGRQHLRPLEAPTRRRLPSGRWFAPVAAAASIAVLVAVSTLVLGPLADRGRTPVAAPGAGKTQAVVAGPPYFVVLEGPRKLVVRNAANGKPIDHTRPPEGAAIFAAVAGTGDSHTFLVAAGTEEACRTRILRLRLHAAGEILALDRVATIPTDVHHLAATRDGTKIAFNSGDVCSGRKLGISVVDLMSGDRRTYTGTSGRVVTSGTASLSWAQEGHTLLFSWYDGSGAGQVRYIDPGHAEEGATSLDDARFVMKDVGVVGRVLLQAAIREWDKKGARASDVLVGVADARWPANGAGGAAIISLRGGRPDDVVASFPESRYVSFDTASTGRSLLVRTDQGIGRLDDGKFQLLVRRDTGSSGHSGATSTPPIVPMSPSAADPGRAGSSAPSEPGLLIFDFAW